MISLKALQGYGFSIQNRKSKIENWYNSALMCSLNLKNWYDMIL
jgi:hypothetical protein